MAKRTAASAPARKRTAPKKKPNEPTPAEDDVRVRAYHRYLERGATHGGDLDDWLEAEKDLKSTRHN